MQTVNRRGKDTIKTEEVRTPRRGSQNESINQLKESSSSPTKRAKAGVFDGEPIDWYLGDSDMSKTRQTLVCLF